MRLVAGMSIEPEVETAAEGALRTPPRTSARSPFLGAAPNTPPRRTSARRTRLGEDLLTPPRSQGRPKTPGAPRGSKVPWVYVPQVAREEDGHPHAMQQDLCVTGLSGKICDLAAISSWDVVNLKAEVERITAIPAFEQQLILDNRELEDDELLYQVLPGGSFHVTLVRRPPHQAQRLKLIAERAHLDLLRSFEAELAETGYDRHIAIAYMRRDGGLLERLPARLRADRGVVLQAIRGHPLALAHAHAQLQADQEVVLTAVWRDPRTFLAAAESLRADRDFVFAAMQGEDHVESLLQHPNETLQRSRDILRRAMPSLQEDPQLLRAAGLHPGSLRLAPTAVVATPCRRAAGTDSPAAGVGGARFAWQRRVQTPQQHRSVSRSRSPHREPLTSREC